MGVSESDIPLVSVCVPVYNEVAKIARTIDSVLKQNYGRLEIIISDNASDDGTVSVIRKYKNHARLLFNDKNIGMVENWRKCLSAANGEYVLFLAANDYLSDDYLAKLMRSLKPGDAIAFGGTKYVCNDDVMRFYFDPSSIDLKTVSDVFKRLCSRNKNNLLINGVYRKDLWYEMLPRDAAKFRRSSLDRIAVLAAVIMSKCKFSVDGSAVYYKDKCTLKDIVRVKVAGNKPGLIKAISMGVKIVSSKLNPMPVYRSSVAFFRQIVLMDGVTKSERVTYFGYWLKWTAMRMTAPLYLPQTLWPAVKRYIKS